MKFAFSNQKLNFNNKLIVLLNFKMSLKSCYLEFIVIKLTQRCEKQQIFFTKSDQNLEALKATLIKNDLYKSKNLIFSKRPYNKQPV